MTHELHIVCVVEGHGDVLAVPEILRRIIQTLRPDAVPIIPPAIRKPKSKLTKPGELERAVELAARKASGGAIFIVVDADDDCAARLGPDFLRRAVEARSDREIRVVIAVREFEAWFVGRVLDLRGYKGMDEGIEPPDSPESLRGAKEWLSRRMTQAHYSEPIDQPAMAKRIDISQARAMGSFDKLFRDVQSVLEALLPPAG